MGVYDNNCSAGVVQSRVHRNDGWASFIGCGWASCPPYGPDGRAELLHIGAGYYDHVAPGFEYALDAPICMPAGSMQSAGAQPYMD